MNEQVIGVKLQDNTFKLGGLLVVVLLVIISCTTTYNTISNRDFTDKYNPAQQLLHPEYNVYNNKSDDIRLYFRFYPEEFRFLMNRDSVLFAHTSLFFRVTKNYSSVQIIDSLTKDFYFDENHRTAFTGYVPLNLLEEGSYVVEVFLTDVLAEYSISTILSFELSKAGNGNSFLFMSKYGSPSFNNYGLVNDTFRVRSSMFNPNGLVVRYFAPDTLLPISPDITKEYTFEELNYDSLFVLEHPDTVLFPLELEGNYLFADQGQTKSKLLNSFNVHYPYVKTSDQMLSGLRYLCNDEEMNSYYELESAKHAVDSFWLDVSNDIEKARELIRVYYNRMQLANYYFSSYKEGWLTDQGMIYTICGAPTTIRTDAEGEHWFYGKSEKASTTFNFYLDEHPVLGSHYVLDRSEQYSGVWYNAITTWRDGRIFSLNP